MLSHSVQFYLQAISLYCLSSKPLDAIFLLRVRAARFLFAHCSIANLKRILLVVVMCHVSDVSIHVRHYLRMYWSLGRGYRNYSSLRPAHAVLGSLNVELKIPIGGFPRVQRKCVKSGFSLNWKTASVDPALPIRQLNVQVLEIALSLLLVGKSSHTHSLLRVFTNCAQNTSPRASRSLLPHSQPTILLPSN
jgi:hypothetical protein